jgi:hypothetical protein
MSTWPAAPVAGALVAADDGLELVLLAAGGVADVLTVLLEPAGGAADAEPEDTGRGAALLAEPDDGRGAGLPEAGAVVTDAGGGLPLLTGVTWI